MHKAINSLCPLARNIPSEIKRERNLLLSIKTQTAIARGTNVKKIQIHLTKVYSDTEAKKLLYLFILFGFSGKLKWRLAKNVLFPYCENKNLCHCVFPC